MKYSRFLIIGALILMLSLPPTISAQSVGDVQSQINQLLQQIRDLQSQILRLRESAVPSSTPAVPPLNWRHRICLVTQQLQEGDENDDVRALQEFLREQGVLSANATGFFGSLTLDALRRWQANNIGLSEGAAATTGWGAFGPRTRAFIARWCGGGFEQGQLSASPQRGAAPLTVSFSARNVWEGSSEFRITFGDGTEGTMQELACTGGCAQNPLSASHTYTTNGTYTATLYRKVLNTCQSTASTTCAAWESREDVVGRATIVVGTTPIACTMEYAPVCGQPPMPQCSPGLSCAQVMPQPQTYGNRCVMNAAGATFLYEGQCSGTGFLSPQPITACPADAYQCPNGQWVGRTGSNCEFKCPTTTTTGCMLNGKTYAEGAVYPFKLFALSSSIVCRDGQWAAE